MIIWALLLAALGFGLLVYALLAGSVLWAWACIAACVGGGVLLVVGALRRNREPKSGVHMPTVNMPTEKFPVPGAPRHRHRRDETQHTGPQRPSWDETDLIRPPVHKEFRRPDRMDDNWR